MARINEKHGGKRTGAGRKSKAEEMGLQALLDKCWTSEAREQCIVKLAKDAMSRHFNERQEARRLLMAYTFGVPKATVDLNHKGIIETRVILPKPDANG